MRGICHAFSSSWPDPAGLDGGAAPRRGAARARRSSDGSSRLEQQLRAVQRRVFPNGNRRARRSAPSGRRRPGRQRRPATRITSLTARVDALEAQLRALTGQVEERATAPASSRSRSRRLRTDLSARLDRLEPPRGAAPARRPEPAARAAAAEPPRRAAAERRPRRPRRAPSRPAPRRPIMPASGSGTAPLRRGAGRARGGRDPLSDQPLDELDAQPPGPRLSRRRQAGDRGAHPARQLSGQSAAASAPPTASIISARR